MNVLPQNLAIDFTDEQITSSGGAALLAHVCVAFVAYTIYNELERLPAENKTPISP